jgi:hypothetical protein
MNTVKTKYAPAPERGITYVGTAGWAIPAQCKDALPGTRSQVSIAWGRASEVWIIFDNTALGHALGNAPAFTEAVAKP